MERTQTPFHTRSPTPAMIPYKNLKRILFISGMLLIVMAVYQYEGIRKFLDEATVTEGTIIMAKSSGLASDKSYTIIVRFTTPWGETIDFRPPLVTNPGSHKKGDKVKVYYLPSNPRNARTDIWGNILFKGGLGGLLLLAIGGIKLLSQRRGSHAEELRRRGKHLVTQVQKVELNKDLTVGGVNPYIVWSQWKDPSTGKTHLLKSRNLWFDPTNIVTGKTVPVYMSPDDPKDYFMDLSFLPKNVHYQLRQEEITPVPVPKKAGKLELRGKMVLLFIAIVVLYVAVSMWKSNPKAAIAGFFMLLLATFFVAMLIWTVYQLSKILGFKCPQCHNRIKKSLDDGGKENVPICFYCEKCDIVWDSGVRTPSSSP